MPDVKGDPAKLCRPLEPELTEPLDPDVRARCAGADLDPKGDIHWPSPRGEVIARDRPPAPRSFPRCLRLSLSFPLVVPRILLVALLFYETCDPVQSRARVNTSPLDRGAATSFGIDERCNLLYYCQHRYENRHPSQILRQGHRHLWLR